MKQREREKAKHLKKQLRMSLARKVNTPDESLMEVAKCGDDLGIARRLLIGGEPDLELGQSADLRRD